MGNTTNRGFRIDEFVDDNGRMCSIQKSSLATDDCIWLGLNSAEPKVFIPHGNPAWQSMEQELPIRPVEVARNIQIHLPVGGSFSFGTRMHLNREQVRELLPALQHFVETGDLLDE